MSAASPAGERPGAYRALGILFAIIGVACFSLRPGFIKLAYAYVTDPVTLIALRMLVSLPFFIAAALWSQRRGELAPISTRDRWSILGLGCLGYYFSSFADFLGLQYVSAGLGRLIMFLYPTMVVVLSALFLAKRPTRRELASLALSYGGITLVLAHAIDGQNANLPLGAALVFASGLGYAIYLVAGSGVVQRVGSVRFTAYAMTVSSVACILQFLLLRPLSALDLPAPVWWLALAIGTLSTALPTFLTAEALRRVGANQVALVGSLGPLITIAFGWLGLGESLGAWQLVGAGLVLAGVMLVSLRK